MATALPVGGRDRFDGFYLAGGIEKALGDGGVLGLALSYTDVKGDTPIAGQEAIDETVFRLDLLPRPALDGFAHRIADRGADLAAVDLVEEPAHGFRCDEPFPMRSRRLPPAAATKLRRARTVRLVASGRRELRSGDTTPPSGSRELRRETR